MRITCFVSVMILLAGCSQSPQESANNPDEAVDTPAPVALTVGELRTLDSAVLSETRQLNIFLPPSYGEGDQRYPVIYLLDGSANEDYHHITGLVQFMTMYQLMPESILVGIANVDRRRDFTFPTKDEELLEAVPTSGGSEAFKTFIGEELQPFINDQYRTTGSKTLIGQSLGALLATEVLLTQPDLFDQYIIVSPSLWWDDQSLLDNAAAFLIDHPELSKMIYFALGSEGEEMQDGMDKLTAIFAEYARDSVVWTYEHFPHETHATILHRAVYSALEFLYEDDYPGL